MLASPDQHNVAPNKYVKNHALVAWPSDIVSAYFQRDWSYVCIGLRLPPRRLVPPRDRVVAFIKKHKKTYIFIFKKIKKQQRTAQLHTWSLRDATYLC
jgi:hypothetical protein